MAKILIIEKLDAMSNTLMMIIGKGYGYKIARREYEAINELKGRYDVVVFGGTIDAVPDQGKHQLHNLVFNHLGGHGPRTIVLTGSETFLASAKSRVAYVFDKNGKGLHRTLPEAIQAILDRGGS